MNPLLSNGREFERSDEHKAKDFQLIEVPQRGSNVRMLTMKI